MHVELHDMLFQMNQIACWVTCMLNNMKFSMLVNMHVSEHVMLFSDEPTLNLINSYILCLSTRKTWESVLYAHKVEIGLRLSICVDGLLGLNSKRPTPSFVCNGSKGPKRWGNWRRPASGVFKKLQITKAARKKGSQFRNGHRVRNSNDSFHIFSSHHISRKFFCNHYGY